MEDDIFVAESDMFQPIEEQYEEFEDYYFGEEKDLYDYLVERSLNEG